MAAPRSFEGVPHHTSESLEGRSTSIKGLSVYLNLPGSSRQMFEGFCFHLRSQTTFLQQFYILHGKKIKKSNLVFTLKEGRIKCNIVLFVLGSLLRLREFGVGGSH